MIRPISRPQTSNVHTNAANETSLKGQYHAIFSNTLKIEKTLFG